MSAGAIAIDQLTQRIKTQARALGFDLCRLLPVTTAPHSDFFAQWLAAERFGEMSYLARNAEKRRNPALLVDPGDPTPATMIVLGVSHYQFDLPAELRADPSRGLIASYAWGNDYHEIIRPLLFDLDSFIRSQTGRQTLGKCLVDTGPVLERDWAHRAGLGFTGKNCCTINPQLGSWLLLATILIPETLVYDPPLQPQQLEPTPLQVFAGLTPGEIHGVWTLPATAAGDSSTGPNLTCGRCTRCLDACPTGAFVGPFHLDPQRCISYWTIESQGPIPRALRSRFGNRIFGCDICQEVCPWNQRLAAHTPLLTGLQAQSARIAPPLLEGFAPANPYWLNADAFAQQFQRSPIKRAKRQGMLRNVCVALGNWGDPQAIAPLTLALADPQPLARGHAAWALGEIRRKHNVGDVAALLNRALENEADEWVREEIGYALGQLA